MSERMYFGWFHDDRTGQWRRVKYDGENSLILTAPPGSGKFTRQIAHTLLTYPGSVFVFDPKGQAYAVTARYRRTLGKVHALDPFGVLAKKLGIATPTSRFNPLALLDPASDEFTADVGLLADAIIIQSSTARYFSDGARQLVQGIIEHERCMRPDASLVDVYRMIRQSDTDFMEYMLAALAHSPSENARDIAAVYGASEAPKSILELWSDAKTQLATFMAATSIQRLLAGNDFDWLDAKRKPVTWYVILPEQHAKTFARFTRLLFASAMKALIAPPRADVLFLMDEIATSLGGAGLEIVNTAFTLGRGYGIRVQAVLQSWSQTRDIWGGQTDAIVASSGVLQFFKPRDDTTARFIRQRAGDRTVYYETESVSESWGSSATGDTMNTSRSRSLHVAAMPLYREQDLYGLGAGAKPGQAAPQLLFMDGLSHPVEAWTLPYWHPAAGLQGRYDPDPYAPVSAPPPLPKKKKKQVKQERQAEARLCLPPAEEVTP